MPRGTSSRTKDTAQAAPQSQPTVASSAPPAPETVNIRIKSYRQRQSGAVDHATGKFRVVGAPPELAQCHNFLFPGEVVAVPTSHIPAIQPALDLGIIEETREPPNRPLFYATQAEALKYDPRRGEARARLLEVQKQQAAEAASRGDLDAQRARERQITMTASRR